MTKELNKAIMTRLDYVTNKYLKEKIADSKIAYDKQRNYCVNVLHMTKKNYFANINTNSKTDNKNFWRTVKPVFSEKTSHKETINMAENETISIDDQVVAGTFNNYLNNFVKNLLTVNNKNLCKNKNGFNFNLLDSVEAQISIYKSHQSLNVDIGNTSKLDNPNLRFEYTSLYP